MCKAHTIEKKKMPSWLSRWLCCGHSRLQHLSHGWNRPCLLQQYYEDVAENSRRDHVHRIIPITLPPLVLGVYLDSNMVRNHHTSISKGIGAGKPICTVKLVRRSVLHSIFFTIQRCGHAPKAQRASKRSGRYKHEHAPLRLHM